MASAHKRALPSTVIIGEMKAGTTALYDYLALHDGIVPGTQKEIHFFSHYWARGPRWYRSHFPRESALSHDRSTLEASPSYLFHPEAATRMHSVLPHARVIVLLRNPIDRAYSHHAYERARGTEWLTFEQSLEAEERRMTVPTARERSFSRSARRIYSYRLRGQYADHLRPWLELFPAEQVRIITTERLRESSAEVVAETVSWLGLSEHIKLDLLLPKNEGHYTAPIDPETRARLARHYAPHNDELYELLGRDLGW